MGHERGASRSAHPDDGVEPTLPVQALHDRRRAPAHRLDRRTAVPCRHQSLDLVPGRPRDLFARDVGRRRRLSEDPRIDEDHVHPVLQETLAEEPVLRPLRVQRSDRDDGRHVSLPVLAQPDDASDRTGTSCPFASLPVRCR